MRTDVAHNFQMASFQRFALDMEWGIAFLLFIGDVCAQIAKGIYQNAYRAVLHALGTRDGVFASGRSQVSGHESHGSTCGFDIDDLWHILEGCNNYLCIITVAQVVGLDVASCHRTDDERSVADTFGCRQVDACVELAWSLDCIFHILYSAV